MHLRKMFNYKVCIRMQTITDTHLEETVHKESGYWSKVPVPKFFLGYLLLKNTSMLSPTNYKQRIPKAHYSDCWFETSKEKSSLKSYRQK